MKKRRLQPAYWEGNHDDDDNDYCDDVDDKNDNHNDNETDLKDEQIGRSCAKVNIWDENHRRKSLLSFE